jgi:hydrogenase maturation protease
MTAHTLVAGIGNIFLSDDGFGVEVVSRLAARPLPNGVRVVDFGIAGIHLAYELLEGYDVTILVDATPRGEEPGTVYVVEPDIEFLYGDEGNVPSEVPLLDAHGMEPVSALTSMRALGGQMRGTLLVVGCEPLELGHGIGLSPPVAGAVDKAVEVILDLIRERAGATVDSHWSQQGHGNRGKEGWT